MAALILLSKYRMKKANKIKHPTRESELPVDLQTFREFHAEFVARMNSHDLQFAAMEKRLSSNDDRFKSSDKKFESIDKRFDEMDKKFESMREEMRAHFHQMKLLLEEQNLRNRQAYDGYLTVYAKADDLEKRIGLECFKD